MAVPTKLAKATRRIVCRDGGAGAPWSMPVLLIHNSFVVCPAAAVSPVQVDPAG